MTDYAKSFDARSLTAVEARAVVRLCSQIVACAGSVKAMAAAVAAEGDSYKAEGYRSAEEQLARQTGMSPTQARRALAAGRRMLGQPEVAKAALAGELSAEQAQAVSAGAEANPAKTEELLLAARDGSMAELNEAVAKARSEGVDLEARRRAIRAARRLSRFVDSEGVYHAFLSGDAEDGITIDQVLAEIRRKLTTSRRQRQVPNDRFDALDYDAMVALFDLACGKDSEISFYDLIDLGLFPQFDPSGVAPRPTAATDTPAPAAASPDAPAAPAATDDPVPAAPASPGGAPTACDSTAGAPATPEGGGVPDLLSFLDDDDDDDEDDDDEDGGGGFGAARSPTGSAPTDRNDSSAPAQTDNRPPPVPPPHAQTDSRPPPVPPPVLSQGLPAARTIGRLAGRPAKIIVRIDLDTLLRGYPMEGEMCDCPGYGPVPVSLIHDLMAAGQARLAGFITKGRELRAVHLERRHPNEYQKTALDCLYPVCAAKGCSTRAGLEADHREDWARTHYTVVDLLDYLCWHHHQLKTRQGWALVDGHGKRDFVPPSDRRHPRHRPRSSPAGTAAPPAPTTGSPPRTGPATPATPAESERVATAGSRRSGPSLSRP